MPVLKAPVDTGARAVAPSQMAPSRGESGWIATPVTEQALHGGKFVERVLPHCGDTFVIDGEYSIF